MSFEEDIANLRYLAEDNPAMAPIIARVDTIPSIGEGYATMHLEGLPGHHLLKYEIDPTAINDPTKPRSIANNPYLTQLLLRGVDAQYQLRDIPGVQRISATGFYEGVPGLVGPLAFIPGVDLEKAPPFSNQGLLEMFKNLEGTLERMHTRGIGHWDIKPGNVIVSGGATPTFIDFSLARRFNVRDAGLMGTVPYFHSDIGRSRDWYAFAVTFAAKVLGRKALDFLLKYNNHRKVPNKAGVAYFIADCANRFEDEARILFLDWINRPEEGTTGPNLEWAPMDPEELTRLRNLKPGEDGGPEPTLTSTRIEPVQRESVYHSVIERQGEGEGYSSETVETLSGVEPVREELEEILDVD